MKILNVWQSSKGHLKYFEVEKPIFTLGKYKIYKQFDKCYLHTFENIGINQLCAANKEYIKNLFDNERPLTNSKFIFDRANETLKKGIELIKN